MKIHLIVAGCLAKGEKNRLGIGSKGNLPWKLRSEMQHFTRMTKRTSNENVQNAVLMGRKTWESIPSKFRPLPSRFNVVVTRQEDYNIQVDSSRACVTSSIKDALEQLQGNADIETCWVIGGSEIYNHFIDANMCDRVYLTKISSPFDCDTFFPDISTSENFKEITDPGVSSGSQEENGIQYSYHVYEKIN